MKKYEYGIWYCSFWINCGYMLISPPKQISEDEAIPAKPEDLPENWEDILENIRNLHYALAGDGSRRYTEDWNLTHSKMKSGWPDASRGTVTITNGNAVICIPPELKSPARKNHLREVLCLNPESGVRKTEFRVVPEFKGNPPAAQKSIPVGQTESGEQIFICGNCRCRKTPHFIWYPKRGKPVYLMLEKAVLMDRKVNMELRDRRHLQEYLTFGHWQKLIAIWNDHNEVKVSMMQHVPDYINLQTRKREQCCGVLRRKGQVIAKIYHSSEDEDERPHFHYRRLNGTEVMISLTGAHYLVPAAEKLTKAEKETLVQYLKSPVPGSYSQKPAYECLCDWWDQLHRTCFFKTGPEGDIFPMPDYMKLRILQC